MVVAGYREAVIMIESPFPSSWRCRPSKEAHAVVLLDAGTSNERESECQFECLYVVHCPNRGLIEGQK